MNLQGKS